jgi:hypothetical protein
MARVVAGAALMIAMVVTGTAISQAPQQAAPSERMSFFITSAGSGNGGDLGGLAGADRICQNLAEAAGSIKKNWRAFLSASAAGGQGAVNARDRIGAGPWYNARGAQVGRNVADLFRPGSPINKETALDERGNTIPGRGDTPNRHDILTGSTADGRTDGDKNCGNWTSRADGVARVGHFDRTGGGQVPTSWVSAHDSRSCSQPDLEATGGSGLFYCFAGR